MSALSIKLFRDLQRLWAQALAIALVVGGGVATLVMSVGSHRSLEETRNAYYERYAFADLFALVRRAPKSLVDQIAEIPGVAAVDLRITKLALLDIPNFREPATGQLISLPEGRQPHLNRLYLRAGRFPESGRAEEVVVTENFAKAHSFALGARFSAILNGRKRELTVVGAVLSPEFIYAIGPGDIMPDERRYGVIWMSERALASAYDLEGAFSFVAVKLLRNIQEREVALRLDSLLERYGGRAAHGRKDQSSHAWLDHELDMLNNMSQTLPPIFLIVAAFLVNLTLTRLVAIEREQIGLFKALGYRNSQVAWHYIALVLIVVGVGVAIGSAVGTLLGIYVTRLFGEFFRFPFLVFSTSPDVYLAAALFSVGAAGVGAIRAVRDIVRLPPAVAMQPPAPVRFQHVFSPRFTASAPLSQPTIMMLRNIAHHPFRAFFTMLGMALAAAILVVSLFTRDTMEQLIDVTYFMSDRQDATISFAEKRPQAIINDIARLPGVLAVEPYREVPARIRSGNIERRVAISGRPRDADLNRIIDINLRPVAAPESGIAVSDMLAQILRVRPGDFVEVDLLEGPRRTVGIPVTARIEDYFGLRAMMSAENLARLMREPPLANQANVSLDNKELQLVYEAVKRMPTVSGMALQGASLANFRQMVAMLVTTMAGIYTALAAIIAFGVVYNSARVSLSERARELASLRVLGFTQGEVFRILFLEIAFLTLVAQPPGWALGYALAWIMKTNLAGELMRVRLVVENLTYVLASSVVIVGALVSAIIVYRRVATLDLVAVLKTRD